MRKVLPKALLAATTLAVAITTHGCSGCGYDESKVVVNIDGKPSITAGDFVYHYKRAVEMAPPQDKPVINTYDDAKDFLDDIIMSRVLELEAEALGYGDDENLKEAVATHRSSLLREATREKIEEGVKVTEAEILDYFNKNKEWRRVSFIMCNTEKRAREAHAKLEAGTPWDDVVREYSEFEENRETGGQMPEPFHFGADALSHAVYDVEVGKYSPVLKPKLEEVWLIFRVEEKVPGQEDEYSQVKDNIRNSIKAYKTDVKIAEYVEKLRKEAEITVDKEMYDAVIEGDVLGAREVYGRQKPPKVISMVGGIPVYFDSWYEGVFVQLSMSPERVEEFKKENRPQFKKIMDERLKALQDEVLLEYGALREGIDKEADFNRDVNRFRASQMVDRIYSEVFVPTIPEVTEGEIKEYFENYPREFQEPERAEIHLVIFPEKKDATEVREAVAGGGDIIEASGKRMEEYLQKEMGGEASAPLPPEKTPVSTMVQVMKEAEAAGPSPGMQPGEGENPIIAELRPRVFKAQKGDLSVVFKLKDGRWAFFRYEDYFPLVQHTLEEEQYRGLAQDGAYREKVASPEIDRKCQAWFEEMRKKHQIEIDEGALKMAYKKVQKL